MSNLKKFHYNFLINNNYKIDFILSEKLPFT